MTTNITTTTDTTTVVVEENIVRIELNNVGVQGTPGLSGVVAVTSPITNSGSAGSAIVGINQALLSITKSQVSDFTSGTVTSAGTAQQAGTALFATNASTAVFATTAGTSTTISGTITKSQVSDFTSGTVTSASTAQQAGTAVYAVNSGTAVYATTSGTAVYSANSGTAVTISGTITKSQVSDFTSGTVAQADNATTSGTAVYATNSGTATYATNAGTATYATTSGTAVFATTSGTAVFATNAGTSVNISGTVTQAQVTNLTTDLAGKANLAGGNAFTGAQTVTASAIGEIPLRVVGVVSQTANLFEVQTSSSTAVRINQVGNTTFTGNITSQNNATFTPNGTATVPLAIQGLLNQSANLQEWRNSGGTVLTRVSSSGQIVSDQQTFIGSGAASISNSRFNVATGSSSVIGQVIRGASGQTADLLNLQDSAGNSLASINSAGGFTGYGAHLMQSFVTTRIPLTIKGAASQTANLQEWQNSAGTVQSSIDSSGMANLLRGNFRGAVYGTGIYYGAVNVLQESGGHGVVIQGRDSQTTDILRIRMGATPGAGNDAFMIQNSGGTTLARIDSGGNIKASNVATLNSLIQLAQANSGGVMIMGRSTAQFSSPGNNSAALYFRDGTNAGTLKLVVRAGAAGAETTILDNIPQ